jgi:hypothetical protein
MGLRAPSNMIFTRNYDASDEVVQYGKLGTIFHGWDSSWYLGIAKNGYPKMSLDANIMTSYAFLPLYPLSIKLVGLLFENNVWGGIFVSNFCFLMAGIVLYWLVRMKMSEGVALKAAIFLFVFPSNFIFSAIQSESLFLLLLLLVFLFLEKKKLLFAGIIGFFLALTKYVGFLVSLPIFLYGIKFLREEENHKEWLYVFISTILPFAGILLYVIYLYSLTGSLNAIFIAERAWGKTFGLNIFHLASPSLASFTSPVFIYNLVLSSALILFALFGAMRLGFGYEFIVISYILIYLATSSEFWHTFSFPRYFSVLFPAYICLAKIGKSIKNLDFVMIYIFFIIQLFLFSFWTHGLPIVM